jgi:hypothetical protein
MKKSVIVATTLLVVLLLIIVDGSLPILDLAGPMSIIITFVGNGTAHQ